MVAGGLGLTLGLLDWSRPRLVFGGTVNRPASVEGAGPEVADAISIEGPGASSVLMTGMLTMIGLPLVIRMLQVSGY